MRFQHCPATVIRFIGSQIFFIKPLMRKTSKCFFDGEVFCASFFIWRYLQMRTTNRITLIGVLTAVNVTSRVWLQFLPNIKPVTSIIILVTIAFGLRFGLELSVTTVMVSGILLGFGAYIPFQLMGWCMIVLFTHLLDKFLPFGKLFVFTIWAFLCGYIYGFFVSLDKLFISLTYFWVYYLNGFLFDTLHAVGNVVFFPLCYYALLPVFRRQAMNCRFLRKIKEEK